MARVMNGIKVRTQLGWLGPTASLFFGFAFLLASSPPQGSKAVAVDRLGRPEIESFLMKCPQKAKERFRQIEQMFRDAGCPDALMNTQRVKGSKDPNLICMIPGGSDRDIVVGAHFDCGSEGSGLIDNWSGAAMLPALYRTLSRHVRRHRFVFIAFAAEEQGLLGSTTYAKKMTPDDVSRTAAMVNLDCLGLGSTAVWVKISDTLLWESMNRAAAVSKLPLRGVNLPSGLVFFDSHPFAERGIPVLVVHSAAQETWLLPHTTSDAAASLDLEEYYNSYSLVSLFLAYLDMKLE